MRRPTECQTENVKGRHHLGNVVVDGRIIEKWMLIGIGYKCVDWIYLAKDSAQWQAVVNMNLPIS
jgi:hypothetical protein